MKSEESNLLSGCLSGNKIAQRMLYEQYSPRLFAICMQYASNKDDAEDILQDVFIKIFEKIKQYKGEGSFEGWMRRITVNTAIKQYHKHNKMNAVWNTAIPENILEEEIKEEERNYDYTIDQLLEMIQMLAPGYRIVFNLYVIEEHSHKEIAEMLNISEGTSKSQLARARVILQKMLNEKRKISENA